MGEFQYRSVQTSQVFGPTQEFPQTYQSFYKPACEKNTEDIFHFFYKIAIMQNNGGKMDHIIHHFMMSFLLTFHFLESDQECDQKFKTTENLREHVLQ